MHILMQENGTASHGVILFDLNGLNEENFKSAQLVFHIQANGAIKEFTGYIYQMDSNWDEQTITWENAGEPGLRLGSFPLRAFSDIVSRNVVSADVSGYLKQALESGQESIGFRVCFDREEVSAISEGGSDEVAAKILARESTFSYRNNYSPMLLIQKEER